MAMGVNTEVLKYSTEIGTEQGGPTVSSPKYSENSWVHCGPWSI
jgi:hypothetical protein